MKDILSMLPGEIAEEIPGFRSKQICEWLDKGVSSFDEMTNLSKDLIASLKERYSIYRPRVLSKQVSSIDGTIKYLWEMEDGNAVETVVMLNDYGNTVCVSTQVGCRQGCAFCASTIGGLVRNLEPSEILNEVYCSEKDSGVKISNVVLMGIGEPLDNLDNVVRFLKLVKIGMRHITLSTCGLIEKFDALAGYDIPINLAVSLHAPDDETRSKIMPANRGRGVDALMEACREYYRKTGRRITFEYAMINGVNDSDYHAKLLAKRAKYVHAHVNLISLNHVDESPYEPSERIKDFIKTLENEGVNVTLRRKLGSDVDASCGQLRRKYTKDK